MRSGSRRPRSSPLPAPSWAASILIPPRAPSPTRSYEATRFYTREQDGLRQAWAGRVWMNPPFNQPTVKDFCARLMDEVAEGRVQAACALLNNNTETALFQAMAQVASAICFPLGRMKFWHPEKEPSAPLQGQAVLYFGQDVEAFRAAFVRFGFTVALRAGTCHP